MIRQQKAWPAARRRIEGFTLTFGTTVLLAHATTAPAQEMDESAVDDQLTTIVVTGSRVAREGYEAPTPTTIVGAEQIGMAAPANVADYLNTLPALPGTSTTRQGNNSISAATAGMNRLDLRGIGTNRTLVLVDGRRYVGSTLAGDVDVNGIPNALIERVEIVTGGASAVYGSDAVAGVVNFILDKDFEGLKSDVQVGRSRYDDAEQWQASLTFGTTFAGGRGHLLASGEYARNEGVPNSLDRPWFKQWGIVNNPDPTGPARLVRPNVVDARVAAGGLITGGPLAGTTFDPGGGAPRAFDYGYLRAGTHSVGGEGDGFYSVVSLEGELTRKNLFTRASFDVSDTFELFGELSYANSLAVTNSSHNYFRANQSISVNNAYLHPAARQAMLDAGVTSAQYGLLLGVASPHIDIDTYRAVVGFEAHLGGWRWETYYQYGQSDLEDRIHNVTNTGNLALALDAAAGPDNTVVCRSTLTAPGNGCVPINTFGGDALSAAALAYVNGTPFYEQRMKQQVVATSISGQPFSSWAGPVSVAFGGEYRDQSVSGDSDAIGQQRGWLFGNFLPTEGSISVKELFAETLVPLAADSPFARGLDLNAAVRLTDYEVSGTVTTWKGGLTYAPVDSVRLRATRSRDIRAPNLNDLYQAGLTQRQNVNDPFRGNVSTNFTRTSSGNLNLDPEVADTTAFGLVLEPSFLPQLRASIDYFSIDIEDAIAVLTNQQIVDRCFEGDQGLCGYIVRDSNNVISSMLVQPINIAQLKVRGMDFDLSFRQPLDFLAADAALTLRLFATRVFEYTENNSFVTTEAAGENAGSVPDLRINATALYQQGPLSLALTARFISDGVLENHWVEGIDIDDNTVPSMVYFDIGGSYRHGNGNLEVYFKVDNIADKAPPAVATAILGTNPTLYDTVGRMMRLGVRYKL